MKYLLPGIIALVGAFSINTARAISIPASEDSDCAKGKVTLASGRATSLGVDGEGSALLRFDLPQGLKVSNVQSARLRLYVRNATKPGDIRIREILSTWSEDVAGAAPTLSEGTVALPEMRAVSKSKQFVFFDVTNLVKNWITSESQTFGVAVSSCGIAKFTLGSKEGAAAGYPAELEIDINPAIPLFVGGDPETELWDGAKIAEGTVGTPQLTDDSVVRSKIASGAVGSNEIAAHSVLANHLAAGSVGNQQIAQGAIDSAKLAFGSVGAGQLAPGSVGESQLAEGSVNALNIALGAVGSEKLNLQYAMFWDEEVGDGGISAENDWQTRKLNSETNESAGAISLSENIITLQPGVYYVRASCPAYRVLGHQAAICDVTEEIETIALLGTSEFCSDGFQPSISNRSLVEGYLKVEGAPRKFELWHYTKKEAIDISTRQPTAAALGKANSPDDSGMPNVYSTLSILKIK